jgi:DNA processing protein
VLELWSMTSEIHLLNPTDFTPYNLALLHEIPQPPKQLWYQGVLPPKDLELIAVVGSRKYTTYGKQIIEHLISGLAGYPVGIVSGLALGVDALAHEAALANKLYTLAVPGSGLDESVLYPASHKKLARNILESGGGLLSELSPKTTAAPWTFPQRNRIMAGLCKATLLIEAGEKSGTLITARMAVDYNRELLAVPGSIFSKNSVGTHQFLKLGATMVTEASDILAVLNIDTMTETKKSLPTNLSDLEKKVIDLLHEPTDKDTLIRQLDLPTSEAGILLMNMEMLGYIKYDSPHYRAEI